MTSIASESVASILVTCKQTRFRIETSPEYREVTQSYQTHVLQKTPASPA